MKQNNIFKVGDRVQISKEALLSVSNNLPDWYSNEIYTILKISSELDTNGNPIVYLDRELKCDNGFQITIFFLKYSILYERKQKLHKIYESR